MHLVDHLVDKGILQQQSGFLKRDAALTHIEECCIVELSYRRAVGAFHIVGIDLKHGLRVHTGFAGGCQVLVRHLRNRFLCAVLYKHTTGKGTHGLVVEHVFIEFC